MFGQAVALFKPSIVLSRPITVYPLQKG